MKKLFSLLIISSFFACNQPATTSNNQPTAQPAATSSSASASSSAANAGGGGANAPAKSATVAAPSTPTAGAQTFTAYSTQCNDSLYEQIFSTSKVTAVQGQPAWVVFNFTDSTGFNLTLTAGDFSKNDGKASVTAVECKSLTCFTSFLPRNHTYQVKAAQWAGYYDANGLPVFTAYSAPATFTVK